MHTSLQIHRGKIAPSIIKFHQAAEKLNARKINIFHSTLYKVVLLNAQV